ncbi:hypothetical protein F5Y12DRAFT_774437 [Xylaria sp. FL1777]|nr:hypothetical protein F5Y12DRAFT_774437 [Xylaria sp. FL1777]
MNPLHPPLTTNNPPLTPLSTAHQVAYAQDQNHNDQNRSHLEHRTNSKQRTQRSLLPPPPPSILSHATATTDTTTPSTGFLMRRVAATYGTDQGLAQLRAIPEVRAAYEIVAQHYLDTRPHDKDDDQGGGSPAELQEDRDGGVGGDSHLQPLEQAGENNGKAGYEDATEKHSSTRSTDPPTHIPVDHSQIISSSSQLVLLTPQPVPSQPWPLEEVGNNLDKITENILYWQVLVARYGAEHRKRGIRDWGDDWASHERYAVEFLHYWLTRRIVVLDGANLEDQEL